MKYLIKQDNTESTLFRYLQGNLDVPSVVWGVDDKQLEFTKNPKKLQDFKVKP